MATRTKVARETATIIRTAAAREAISDEDVQDLYSASKALFRELLGAAGYEKRVITALLTKYNDAGPRSAPWRPVSGRGQGRPQDGLDGNRISRWDLPKDHKFYSTRVNGTLVAVKYIFQTLSMAGAPAVPPAVSEAMTWLVGHPVSPGEFLDPIQKVPVELSEIAGSPRLITSGHLLPLDRGGRHLPDNTSLLLKKSNDLQGNNTIDELLEMIRGILDRHGRG
jgi:hypothetical protein